MSLRSLILNEAAGVGSNLAPTDPYWDKVRVLMNMEGLPFTDEIGNEVRITRGVARYDGQNFDPGFGNIYTL